MLNALDFRIKGDFSSQSWMSVDKIIWDVIAMIQILDFRFSKLFSKDR